MPDQIPSVHQFDTGPPLQLELLSEATRLPVDLTGATVVAHMYDVDLATAIFTDAPCTLVDATAGRFAMAWPASSTDKAGTFPVSFEITFAGGTKETYPSDGYLYVRVRSDLNGA